MWWHNDGWDTGAWLLMGLIMVVFSVIVIAVVIWLVRGSRSDRYSGVARTRPAGADEILAERFARGELDEHEFKRRRALLHAGRI
jgi:putative membrane protein